MDGPVPVPGDRRVEVVDQVAVLLEQQPRRPREPVDPGGPEAIGPVVASFAMLVSPDAVAPAILRSAERREFYALARETMLGLALGRATNGGEPLGHEASVLRRLRAEAAALDR